MSSVDRKTYMAKLRLNEMLADHDVSLPADLYDEIVASLREQPEARGVVDVIPEAVQEMIREGWSLTYSPDTGFIGFEHPWGGKQSLLEITRGRRDQGIGEFIVSILTAAQQPAQAAPGWKLVPVVATPEMLEAATGLFKSVGLYGCYAAMLDAAPTPPGDDAAGGGQ